MPGPLPCVVSILCRVYFRTRALCRVVSIARGKVSSPGMTAQFLLQHGVGLYRNARFRRLIWCISLVLHLGRRKGCTVLSRMSTIQWGLTTFWKRPPLRVFFLWCESTWCVCLFTPRSGICIFYFLMFPRVAVRFLSLLLGAYVCYELCYVGVVLAGVLARCLTPTSSSWRCVSISSSGWLRCACIHT